ncbi:MAG: bifunctional riboflavin kinase/FAD synthetase [Rhodobiaceae bacterium]|nr:bifunctional riboflavin kinase/FAD synthetase [Rhodobiaceae bacterium]
MQVTDLDSFPDACRGGVIAIGNFDGVHSGHRAVIGMALAIARQAGVPAGVMTFEPHPRSVFRPDTPVFRLTPRAEKRRVLSACGLDFLLEMGFDRAFAARTAADFVDTILIGRLGISHVVTGFDFHFGKGREGTPDFLRRAAEERGFGATIVPALASGDGVPVSSSAVRDLLEAGDVAAAAALLGYRWFVSGPVIHGEKRGRDLGYPTANMRLGSDCGLAHGVYAVRMEVDGTLHDGVASYGRRPQFDNGAPLLETYLFDFSGDLYDRPVAVEFVAHIRPELKFDSVEALVARMDEDSREARAHLAAISGEAFGPDALSCG